jgi:hypothetical protein
MPADSKQASYYRHDSRSNFKLTSVNSATQTKSARASRNRSPDTNTTGRQGWDASTFRPDQSTHTTTVSFYDKKKGGSSIHSHDSQKMIIERKVDYTVTYDDRSLKEDGGSSADGHV